MRALPLAGLLLGLTVFATPAAAERLTILISGADPTHGFTSMQECKNSPSTFGSCEKVIPGSKCSGRTVYTSDLTATALKRAYNQDRVISITSRANSVNEAEIYCDFNTF